MRLLKMKLHKTLRTLLLITVIFIIGFITVKYSVYGAFKYYYSNYSLNKPRILLIWYRGIGEQEFIERIKVVAKNKNIEFKVLNCKPRFYIRWFVSDAVNKGIQYYNPDFILTIQDWIERFGYPEYKNYLTLTLNDDKYINNNFEFINKEHIKYDIILPSFLNTDKLTKAYNKLNRENFGFSWYPTSNIFNYNYTGANKIFYSGGFLWDNERGSNRFISIFSMLDKQGYFQVCGPHKKWQHTPNSTIGLIPIDGKSLIKAHNQAGISLIIHTKEHRQSGTPTGRIFEAAAANTVIISDKNAFIENNFGDNVLYIDLKNRSAEDIYSQIDNHYKWILANPNKAKTIANNCNQIFKTKFSLEQQIDKLLAMHNKISS